jgi:hypothetical protein
MAMENNTNGEERTNKNGGNDNIKDALNERDMRFDQLAFDLDQGSAQTFHADLARNDAENVRQDMNSNVDVFDGADHSCNRSLLPEGMAIMTSSMMLSLSKVG